MSEEPSTLRDKLISTHDTGLRARVTAAARLVASHWENGEQPDLPEAIRAHPCLVTDRSVFFDLVQKEYRLQVNEWRNRPPADYCRRFSTLDSQFLQSLYRLIEVEQCLEQVGLSDLLGDEAEVSWPAGGEPFVEFKLLEELGRGALARVFLAIQPQLGGRKVVVKITRSAHTEAGVLGRLSHPHVVPVYSTGTDDSTGLGWICMPYLGRCTLEHSISHHFFSIGTSPGASSAGTATASDVSHTQDDQYLVRTLQRFGKLADGLAHIHDRGLTHGDLKPSNILITDEGVPTLIDFNLAQETDIADRLAGGTLPYMAPEQLRRLVADDNESLPRSTVASEMFSFGVVLHHALTGELPFTVPKKRDGVREIATELLASQQAWHSVDRPKQIYDGLLRDCLALQANVRPSTMRSVSEALDELVAGRTSPLAKISRRTALISTIAVCSASAVGATYLTGSTFYDAVESARLLVQAGQTEQAVRLLEKAIETNPSNLRARRLLADLWRQSGEYKKAAEAYLDTWKRGDQPSDLAICGYCMSRYGDDKAAIYAYEETKRLGISMPAIDHNLAVGKLNRIAGDYDFDLSSDACDLLLSAYRHLPDNESVRLAMFRHSELAEDREDNSTADYPIDIAALPSSKPSVEFCWQAIRYLVRRRCTQEQLGRYAPPCLRLLVAYLGQRSATSAVGPEAEKAVSSHLAEIVENNVARCMPPTQPPQFLLPIF